ncbi:MAG TPA: helix-turn-helix transcriptional regulator [Leptolyngbyaceae cyanobacterium M65_K2018_010]|nr:helix-turn-helix transcriptional regulator [Leptolyngbyaceae cyanobacterium M65_K2018_010]
MVSTSLQVAPTPTQTPDRHPDVSLLTAVLEGFADGVLILTQTGHCLHRNQKGKALCRHLHDLDSSPQTAVPPSLWALCLHLREGRDLFPDQSLVLTQDFSCPGGACIRARVQWFDWPETTEPSFLVMLEDQTQAVQTAALLEAMQYDLTPREREVWMLRRANHSYEAIALTLYITVNTVKRHLKSIYAKRKQVLEDLAN